VRANVPTLFGPQLWPGKKRHMRLRETRFSSAPMSLIQTLGPNTLVKSDRDAAGDVNNSFFRDPTEQAGASAAPRFKAERIDKQLKWFLQMPWCNNHARYLAVSRVAAMKSLRVSYDLQTSSSYSRRAALNCRAVSKTIARLHVRLY
jgi:hypothetical protein